jgi:putative ABC transport system permease protein
MNAPAVSAFVQDVRFGLRLLLRRPALSAGLILTLALGLGANASIFSVVSSVLLHPLPFRQADRLAVLWAADRKHADQQVEVSYRDLVEWQRRSRVFESFAALSSVNLDIALTGGDRPQQVEGMLVSDGFFNVLGSRAHLGRTPTPADVAKGDYLAVISYRLWQSRYAGDPGIIGRRVMADHNPCTIVAVMPPDFDFPHNVDFWYPSRPEDMNRNATIRVYSAIGRLRPGYKLAQVRSEMESIAGVLAAQYPEENRGLGVRVDPMERAVFGKAQPALWLLMAAVGLLLLAACVNAGNLLLSRAMDRTGEMRLRAALGAGRGRVVRQMLAEGLPIGILGGAAGLLLASYGVSALVALAPSDIPRMARAQISGTVLLYTWLLSLATVLVFMLPAALHASREAPLGRTAARRRTRGLFVTAQVAVSMLLIVGAITLARGFVELNRIDPGFHRDHVLTFRITLSKPECAQQEARKRFYEQLLERLRSLPGASSAAAILLRPLSGTVGWDTIFTVEGQTAAEQATNPVPNYEAISPDYFRTMRIPILTGRDFTALDRTGSERVAIVSAALARRYWPGQNAVGKRLKLARPDAASPWLAVVAVVADVRYREWETSRFDIYIPVGQRAQHRSDFVVRTSQDPLALSGDIQRAVAAIDKDQPVSSLTTVDSLVDETFALPRFNLTLLALFAGCALALAMAGVFALLTHSVTQRIHEIGIRIALGARRADVIRLVVVDGIAWTALGIACGVLAAAAAGRILAGSLAGMRPPDAATILAAAATIMLVALSASLLPARRASQVDPIHALRHE